MAPSLAQPAAGRQMQRPPIVMVTAPQLMHYNFCRIHQSLRVTPAMEAGITDHVWELWEVVRLMDYVTAKAARPRA